MLPQDHIQIPAELLSDGRTVALLTTSLAFRLRKNPAEAHNR